MNQQAYESGKLAYQSGDWLTATTYLGGCKEDGEAAGEVDHLRGNAYMKLGQYDLAASCYADALADESYGKKGALSCNRGRALIAAGRPQEAVEVLTSAVQDSDYPTPYKAYMALGAAYDQLGDARNAGIAYRNAAIDDTNPAPANSLNKLGSCFMRLGRPVDAVEAYRTALDFTGPRESQSQIFSNLGMAYFAANRMSESVDAFGRATADGNYTLTPEAQASYDAASKAIAQISARKPSDTDAYLAAAGYASAYDPLDPTGSSGELMPSPEDTGFFSLTEDQIIDQYNQDRRALRKKRHTGLKVFLFILLLVLLLAGGLGFAFWRGYGWPTQEAVITSLFEAKTNGEDISDYVVPGASEALLQEISDDVPTGASVSVNGCDQSMLSSTVYVTATLAEGGKQGYLINMTREGISWKVSSIETSYLSQGDSTSE